MKISTFSKKSKLAWLIISPVFITVLAITSVSIWQTHLFDLQARLEIQKWVDAHLNHVTENVYNMVRACDEAMQQEVDAHLKIAHYVLNSYGKPQFSKETVEWVTVNQFTREPAKMMLPKMMVGELWLGQNNRKEVKTPIIDEVTQMVGNTVTIFQRMNEQGDLVSVATNMETSNDTRAIGVYMPARNPDGMANPIVATLLNGNKYRGMAYVVNTWYVSAYEPLWDEQGKVIGALYTGIKQENATPLRQAILRTKISTTGYVYVLGGKGLQQGHYTISKDGQRDGEDIWKSIDNSGRFFIQSIVTKAVGLRAGEFATERYPWKNLGESEPRWKIVRFAYYEPWDWVIGVSVYEDELQEFAGPLTEGYQQMVVFTTSVAVMVFLLSSVMLWFWVRNS